MSLINVSLDIGGVGGEKMERDEEQALSFSILAPSCRSCRNRGVY